MCTGLGPEFEALQDDFIVDRYLRPAREIMRLNDAEYEEIFGSQGSYNLTLDAIDNLDGDEFMTALLSAVYSDFYTADLSSVSASGINIGRANLIPFLYNVDETGTDGKEIARYAYIAYIEGFLTAGRTDGFHYWEQEYESVFNESYNDSDYDVEALRVKFDRALDVLSDEQGNKGNRLLGATITEVIRSPYNVSTQLAQAKNIINDILGDIGVDNEYKDLIAKNYLMVKHMMDNSHIDRTIKDYCQGVVFNESKFSQGQFDEKNSNTALLSDFQLVECNKGWRDDTDKDGLSDKEELGNQVKHDITAFVKKKLNAGEDLWTKANAWKEFNDMIIVEGTSSADCKVYAKMYDYTSNPVLRDTDFDGIEDGNGWGIFGAPLNMRVDEDPKNNNFKGSRMTTREGDLNLEYNSDFRYLMWSENLYNDELSQMSLIMSNLAHNETITLKEKRKNYGTMNIRSYMERLGFTGIDTEELTYETDIKVRYYIGYKSIDYYSKKRGVIGIFLSTNESVEAYKKLAVDLDYLRDNNLYDQIARDIYSKISTDKIHALETEYGLDYCYWVSGKGIAGGIASEVATIIRKEDNDFKRSNNWYTIKYIYCYTFGAPKTHIGANYTNNFIKNIINEDDYLTKVIPDDKGYRNGFTYNASVYSDFIYNYKNLIRTPKYNGNYMQMNSVKNALNTLRKDHPSVIDDVNDDMSKLLSKHISNTSNEEDMKWTKNYVNTSELATEIVNQVSNRELESASSVKAYWTLAKVLEGLDEKTINQRSYNKTAETANSEIWSYIAFPCYQKKVGIPINNEVPMYFQTNERWSRFRYGRRSNYTDNENDNDNRVMREDSNYSYGTFYESACGACAPAMVLSYLYKKYITPMDVRNKLEDEEVYYRNGNNGGAGTEHSVLTNDIPDIFDVNCQGGQLTRTNDNVKSVLKALIEGKPVVALCHGSGSASDHSSYFTTYGHYITIAGVNKDDILNVTADNIDEMSDNELNNIRIYVCDSAYYHHRNRNKRTCTTAYRFSDFTDKARAGVDSFWIYTKDADATYDDDLWDYRNSSYTETFNPQTYTEYASSGNITINRPYGVFKWEEPTWEFLN